MRIILWAVAVIACAGTAVGEPTPTRQNAPIEAEIDNARLAAAAATYGEWLVQLAEVQESIQEEFTALQGHWQALSLAGPGRGAPQFRRELAASLDRIDAGIAGLEHMSLPDVSVLDLEEDVQPATIVSQVAVVLRELRNVMAEYEPLLEAALRNDSAAASRTTQRMIRSLGLAVDSQIVTARASLAITPRELSDWELTQMDLLYLRSTARLFSALRLAVDGMPDQTLARDLVELASQFEQHAEAGRTKLRDEVEEMIAQRDDIPVEEDAEARLLLDRAIVALRVSGRSFDVGVTMAGAMRSSAEGYRQGVVPVESLLAQLRQFQGFHSEFGSVGVAAAAALAGRE